MIAASVEKGLTMRHPLVAAVFVLLPLPLYAQGAPAMMGEMGTPSTLVGRLPTAEAAEIGGNNVVPRTSGDATLAGSARLDSGDQKIRLLSEQRRGDAVKLAEMVRKGAQVPADYAPKLREAIDGDMELWRDQYKVESKTFKEARRQWLDGANSMDANTLAILRAELFGARDKYNAAIAR